MTTNKTPRIAIIGGGLGGLMLARVLQTRHISATVFERESHPEERSQGGSLDLHPDSGLLAIHLAELDEQFHPIARYEDQGLRIINKEGKILFKNEQNEEPGNSPAVDRTALRTMLLDSLAPGVVRWGQNLRSIHQTVDGTYAVLFEHGLSETFDLVVGADGAWSRVRPLLSRATPSYTGVTFIEIGLDDVDHQHPEASRLVGHGIMFALADQKGMIAQRNGHGHIRTYITLLIPENGETTTGFDTSSPQVARAWLLDQFADWDASLHALIKEGNDRFIHRPLYTLPIGHHWDFRSGVTLLGDAAHLISPFAGEGANLAMLDAANLACVLSDSQNFDDAVRSYEQAMFLRAEVAAKQADESLKQATSPNAAAEMAFFFSHMPSFEPAP